MLLFPDLCKQIQGVQSTNATDINLSVIQLWDALVYAFSEQRTMQLVCFSTGKLIPCIKHEQNKKMTCHVCETRDRAARQVHYFNGTM